MTILGNICRNCRQCISVLVRVTIPVTKHHDQKQAGKKKCVWLTFLHDSSTSKKARTGTEAGQEPGRRSWCRHSGGALFTGLLPMATSASFLIEPRTTSPRTKSLTMGCPPPTRALITNQENTLQVSYSPILGKYFLNRGSLFSDDSSFYQLT